MRSDYKWSLETNVEMCSNVRCEPMYLQLSTCDWFTQDDVNARRKRRHTLICNWDSACVLSCVFVSARILAGSLQPVKSQKIRECRIMTAADKWRENSNYSSKLLKNEHAVFLLKLMIF